MTMQNNSKLFMLLVGVLVVVVAVQSVVMAKLYQKTNVEPLVTEAGEPVQMQLKPWAVGTASAGAKKPGAQNPVNPFGGFQLDPGTWDPFSEFRNIRQQMDQIFNDSFGRFRMNPDFESLWGGTAFSPNMDIEEQNGNYVVRMDIPGADKSDISVNIKDRVLEVSGKTDETVEEQGQRQLRKERRSGQFKRAFTLPGPVKVDEMEARYEDGVLVVTVPKADEEKENRTIEVK
ncbi:Hsp20/alpha crystallin family protein [Pontiellaceae bacterium B1224]|nr:Hsp20/alpha crystallin family protein [Pontiellaceae bacterium B1224]